MSSVSSHPRSVEEIRRDYGARRKGILRALTTDVDEFYALCDPEKENLCLYGYPNGGWEVAPPAEEVPPEMPEPALGINFARDGMRRREWLSLIAIHSDAWLLSVAFFFGTMLNRSERKRLFTMINEVPTIYEVLSEKDKAPVDGGSKTKSSKRSAEGQLKSNFESQLRNNPKPSEEAYAEDDEEHSDTCCGTCGGSYSGEEFWIGCDVCERWFHGKCVKITPAKAESIQQYKCPDCSSKKGWR